jgi:hypothetical protein
MAPPPLRLGHGHGLPADCKHGAAALPGALSSHDLQQNVSPSRARAAAAQARYRSVPAVSTPWPPCDPVDQKLVRPSSIYASTLAPLLQLGFHTETRLINCCRERLLRSTSIVSLPVPDGTPWRGIVFFFAL